MYYKSRYIIPPVFRVEPVRYSPWTDGQWRFRAGLADQSAAFSYWRATGILNELHSCWYVQWHIQKR